MSLRFTQVAETSTQYCRFEILAYFLEPPEPKFSKVLELPAPERPIKEVPVSKFPVFWVLSGKSSLAPTEKVAENDMTQSL